MNFTQGFEQSDSTQRLIAFWTHTIDKFALSIETVPFDDELDDLYVPTDVMQRTGAANEDAYLGMARAGFHLAIQTLPVEVKLHVEKYLCERMALIEKRVPEEILDSDVLLGTGNTFS
jgi:hypothetical protein